MKPNPLRLMMTGYALALLVGAMTGLAGWPLLLAFWLGGPLIVLGLAALPVLGMPTVRVTADHEAGPDGATRDTERPASDPNIADWDADRAAEALNAALQAGEAAPAAAAGRPSSEAPDPVSSGARSAAG